MTEDQRTELDLAAGLRPRDPGLRRPTMLIIAAAVIAGALACTAVVLSIIAFTRIDDQANDSWSQRRRATYSACRELERTKADARILLESYGITLEKLPLRPGGGAHVFAPGSCDQVVEERIPASSAPPGASLTYK